MLVHNRDHNKFIDYRNIDKKIEKSSYDIWVQNHKSALEELYPAITFVQLSDKQKRNFFCDQKNYIVKPLNIGDRVNIKNQDKTAKHQPSFIGPFIVKNVRDNGKYDLTDCTIAQGPVLYDVPISHMKLESTLDDNIIPIPIDDIYYIEKITAHRGIVGNREYKIKWVGYDDSSSTWEPAVNIMHKDEIRDYWRRIGADETTILKEFIVKDDHAVVDKSVRVLPDLADVVGLKKKRKFHK